MKIMKLQLEELQLSTTLLIRSITRGTSSNVMVVKQIRNHPGSMQWQADPGVILILAILKNFSHNSISPFSLYGRINPLISAQQNIPALLLAHLIPSLLKQSTNSSRTCRILFRLVSKYSRINLLSESIEVTNLWVGADIEENLVNFLAAAKTLSLNEHITPTLNPARDRSFDREYTM
ncbi:hypothetical protein V8G54_012430 [Vigna mungo]|uniref:Uncharacterized protein n=1 Tax=Vigna mungo TaxID=3915 RepID=A0AAQ3NRR0_VIGMU